MNTNDAANKHDHNASFKAVEYEFPVPPPELTTEQTIRGGQALKTFQQYAESMFEINKSYVIDSRRCQQVIQNLLMEKMELKSKCFHHVLIIAAEAQEKNERIAKIQLLLDEKQKIDRTQKESDRLYLQEKELRIRFEKQALHVISSKEKQLLEFQKLLNTFDSITAEKNALSNTLSLKTKEMAEKDIILERHSFVVDELKVNALKLERKNDELTKNKIYLEQTLDHTTQQELILREENGLLQKKIRELLDANKELTINYQSVKKNHDLKRHETDSILAELEEAKNACQIILRQRKEATNEAKNIGMANAEMASKIKILEETISEKDKELTEYASKLEQVSKDFEQQLVMKDEQIWNMHSQMDEVQQQTAQILAERTSQKPASVEAAKRPGAFNIDADLLGDIEKKFKAREKVLTDNIETMELDIKSKQETITKLNYEVADLTRKQFQPRMERLKLIEHDIKNRMEEYVLAEERMETGFLCPRDLQFFKIPLTLIPCHTFCKCCVESIAEENYNTIKCPICQSISDGAYRNEQLESIGEQFNRRKSMVISFLDWMKSLKVYLPPEYNEDK